MANTPDHLQAINFAIERLRHGLSPQLTYHNLWHTLEDVFPSCGRLAQHTGVPENDLRMLEVAAAFHDLGFTEDITNHELAGARIAAQELPDFGFSARQIEQVMGMIIATRLPQSPRNLLEEILADADLDVLGRTDFMPRNEALRQEWINYGREIMLEQWVEGQLAFLKSHNYFTPAAKMLRNDGKKKNIASLEEKLRLLTKK